MTVIHVEHAVADLSGWIAAFDRPEKDSGMRHYRILRPTERGDYLVLDCEFVSWHDVELYLHGLREIWRPVGDAPPARVSVVEEVRS